jgi:hypothetical protein
MGITARKQLFGTNAGRFANLIEASNRIVECLNPEDFNNKIELLVEPFEAACHSYLTVSQSKHLEKLDLVLCGDPVDEAVRRVSWVVFSNILFLELLRSGSAYLTEAKWRLFLLAAKKTDPRVSLSGLAAIPTPDALDKSVRAIAADLSSCHLYEMALRHLVHAALSFLAMPVWEWFDELPAPLDEPEKAKTGSFGEYIVGRFVELLQLEFDDYNPEYVVSRLGRAQLGSLTKKIYYPDESSQGATFDEWITNLTAIIASAQFTKLKPGNNSIICKVDQLGNVHVQAVKNMKTISLTKKQRLILSLLSQHGPQTAAELKDKAGIASVEAVHTAKRRLNEHLDQLEQGEVVQRTGEAKKIRYRLSERVRFIFVKAEKM